MNEASQLNDNVLAETHKAILRLALTVIPVIFVAECILELTDGDSRLLPRWYVYLSFWLIGLWLYRRRPNALTILIPAVAFLSIGVLLEATTGVDIGVPDTATALALIVGLGILAAVISFKYIFPVIGLAALAVLITATVTGVEDGLPGDDLVIRIAASALIVSLAAWTIYRLRDDLDRKAAQLTRLVGARDRLIAGVSHELRTPLTGIVGFSDELLSSWDHFSNAEALQLIGTIATDSRDMADMVEDLLVAARVDDDIRVHLARVDLREEVDALLANIRMHEGLGNRSINVAGEHVSAWADPVRIRQVIRNLVTNAVRYGGADISITIGSDGDAAFVDVSDNGSSLEHAHAELVFEPYFTAPTAARIEGSVGLGLHVSRRLARLMGGDVVCDVQPTGTTFRFRVAAASPSVDEAGVVARHGLE